AVASVTVDSITGHTLQRAGRAWADRQACDRAPCRPRRRSSTRCIGPPSRPPRSRRTRREPVRHTVTGGLRSDVPTIAAGEGDFTLTRANASRAGYTRAHPHDVGAAHAAATAAQRRVCTRCAQCTCEHAIITQGNILVWQEV